MSDNQDPAQQVELIKSYLADEVMEPLIKPHYRARSSCYWRNECDWDFEESGYDKQEVIEAFTKEYLKTNSTGFPVMPVKLSGVNKLYTSHEIMLPIGLDEDGYFDVQTFRTVDAKEENITIKDLENTRAWAELQQNHLKEIEAEKQRVKKAEEAREAERMKIYFEVKAKLEATDEKLVG